MNIQINPTRAAFMLLLTLMITSRSALLAQNPHDYGWQVGYGYSVGSSVVKGDTMYVGGDFDYIGQYNGSLVSASLGTAEIKRTFPVVNGTIRTMIPDGSGGYFIGGSFTRVGGYDRVGLAHILADKTLDPTWNINIDKGSSVYTLLLSNTKDTLWVGGNFQKIGGLSKNAVAAIRVSAKAVISTWGPGLITPNWWSAATVSAIAYFPGSSTDAVPKLFIGGDFNGFNWNLSRANLAALNPVNGQPISAWKSDITHFTKPDGKGASPVVRALLVHNNRLYIGGIFTRVTGGQNGAFNRHSLTAMLLNVSNSGNGWVDNSFNDADRVFPKAEAGRVNCFGLVKDGANATMLGIGGKFYYEASNSINQSFVMADPSSAQAKRYNSSNFSEPYVNGTVKDTTVVPNVYETGEIFAFEAMGSQVVLAGDFEGSAGSEWNNIKCRRNLAILDMTNSVFRDWMPVMQTNLPVRALHVSGGDVVVAGSFTSAGGELRRNMAAVLLSNYTILPFNPRPDSYVNDMVLSPTKDTLYIGGNFTLIGSTQRGYTASFDLRTKSLLNWGTTTGTGGGVEDILLDPARNILYAGGKFNKLGALNRNHLAALDSKSGQVISNWTADIATINGQITPVRSLALAGDTLYVGGRFDNISGQARANLAALKTTLTSSPAGATATLLSWNFPVTQAQADIGVCALMIDNGRMYVGGKYTAIGGNTSLQNLAAISLGNPNTLDASWAPVVKDGGGGVWCMQVLQGTLYIGGDFGTIDGVPVSMAGALNLADGRIMAGWKPYPNIQFGTGGVILNLMINGHYVYLGGSMENMTENIHDAVYHLATIASLYEVLPVQLVSFTATATQSGSLVQWKSPEDIDDVILQRSTDGIHFTDLGYWPAGTVSYLDKTVLPGTTYYYRLKLKANASTTFSTVRIVTISGANKIRVLNNVISAGSTLKIWTTEDGFLFRVFTAAGQLVLEQSLRQGSNEISFEGSTSGLYFYSVAKNNERVAGKLVIR